MIKILKNTEKSKITPFFELVVIIGYGEHCDDMFTENAIEIDDKKADSDGLYTEGGFPDFNPYIKPNFRAQDHNKKWYHTDAETKVEYCPDPEAKLRPDQTIVDPEKLAIFNLMVEDYWKTLDDTEKKIYRLREQGYTQEEVAKILGYSGNSAVSKRLKTMRAKFKDVTGI